MGYIKETNIFFYILLFLFLSLFAIVKPTTYSSSSFKESNEKINNPDQGFYKHIRIFITPDSFKPESNTPDQMYHLRCDISQFSGAVNSDGKDKKLTDLVLNELDDFLYKIKKENKNAVIRFSYDPRYGGNKDKEPSLSTIETHVKQLSEILNKHEDTLTAIEAGLLGPYGEMHTSKIATEENKALVFKYWLKNTKNIPILARTPKAIFTYFGKTLDEMEKYTIKSTDEGYRLGLFNDGYLATDTDYGTYKYDRKRETKWLAKQNEHLPYGGETAGLNAMNDLDVCLPEMFLLKLSYLNSGHNHDVIAKWKNLTYTEELGEDNLFYMISGYDYIERHLGYRLFIKSISVDYEKYSSYETKIKLNNVGFGNMLKPKKMDIIFTDMKDKEISRKNVGDYKGELSIEVKDKLLPEDKTSEYKVYLSIYGSIENKIVYYPIQFANKNIYNKDLKAHLLFYVKKGELVKP